MNLKKKIKSPTQLKASLSRLRPQNNQIVFTNGCFDLLHKGHVIYLEKAKKQGDILVVALNSDRSVKKLKGKRRPINSLRDRMEVIAALESVDFVTSFSEDTPIKLIHLLKPDVLVKGGDWKPQQIVGAKEVKAWGGRVRSISFIKGRSSTQIIRKVRL